MGDIEYIDLPAPVLLVGDGMNAATHKDFILLSGLPRSGSTLLVALLTQNPVIYGEGLSALCQLMWDNKRVCENIDALAANNRLHTKTDILSALPYLYYKDVDEPIIIEKGRTWPHPFNFSMWLENVCPDQKIIVTVRPAQDVLKSIAALRVKNGWEGDPYAGLLERGSEPVCRAAEAIALAREYTPERLLFVDYRDLTNNPAHELGRIYNFYGFEEFHHYFDGIEHKRPENDEVHGLIGMHDVRSTIATRSIDIEVPEYVKAACVELDALVYGT